MTLCASLGSVVATPTEIVLPVVAADTANELAMGDVLYLFFYHVNDSRYNQYEQLDYLYYSGDWFKQITGGDLVIATAISNLIGDVNGDAIVNGQDLALVSSNWLKTGPNMAGDVNGDGIVNGQDLAFVSSSWMNTAEGEKTSAVPEPSTLILAALGGLVLFAMRRRVCFRDGLSAAIGLLAIVL